MQIKDPQNLSLHLLGVNKDAFDQQLFIVAYHALSGAMNCALRLHDNHKLAEIEQIARAQLCQIDTSASEILSTCASTEQIFYDSLVRLVSVRRSLLQNHG